MGIKSRKGVTQGSSSFFNSRAVLPPWTNVAPKLGERSGKGRLQPAKFGRKAPCPILAHTKGYLCPVEETQQCLEKPNREAKRNQSSFKTLWLQQKKKKKVLRCFFPRSARREQQPIAL